VTARRFRHESAGRVTVGIEFDSDTELEAFLAGRGLTVPAVEPRTASPVPTAKVGRPNLDGVISAAVRSVAIGDAASKATIARSVQARIAAAGGMAVPSERSIIRRLKESDKTPDRIMDKIQRVR
jgi:hypothetical protein